jgi:hypothetical protein
MTDLQKSNKALNIALWVLQVILASIFIWAAWMKLLSPFDKLTALWPWTGQIPITIVKLTGVIDLLGAMGLILPALLRIKPKLTPITAIAIILQMICAAIFHILRGEASVIGVNIFFAIAAAFIAWGRLKKASLIAK